MQLHGLDKVQMRPVVQMRPTTERERPIFDFRTPLQSLHRRWQKNVQIYRSINDFFSSDNGTSTTVFNITLHDKSAGSSSGTCYLIDCRCSTYKFINFSAVGPTDPFVSFFCLSGRHHHLGVTAARFNHVGCALQAEA